VFFFLFPSSLSFSVFCLESKMKKGKMCAVLFSTRVFALRKCLVRWWWNFLDFGNCMAIIELRGFWIGFGLRCEETDFSCGRGWFLNLVLLLACCCFDANDKGSTSSDGNNIWHTKISSVI